MDLNIITKDDARRRRAVDAALAERSADAATEPSNAKPPEVTTDDLYSRLLKYIPAPLIGIYLMAMNLIVSPKEPKAWLAWTFLAFFLIVTVVYLRARDVRRPRQIVFSLFAFTAWAAASPGPFQLIDGWENWYGTLALAAVAAVVIAIKLPALPSDD